MVPAGEARHAERMREPLAITRATEPDLPEILALANWAAEHTAANFATEPEPLDEWRQAFRANQERYPWLVARSSTKQPDAAPGPILGFAKAAPHKSRGAYAWCAEVTVYVHPERHGQRVGSALYALLIPLLRAQSFVTLLAGITVPNPASEKLHAAFGFTRCGVFPRAGWKFGQWHDVAWWSLELHPASEPPRELRTVTDVMVEFSND